MTVWSWTMSQSSHRLVGVDHVAELGHGHADALALGLGQDPLAGHRAGRVAGRVEQDLVPGLLQASGQLVDDQLDPAVEDGHPRNRLKSRTDNTTTIQRTKLATAYILIF